MNHSAGNKYPTPFSKTLHMKKAPFYGSLFHMKIY